MPVLSKNRASDLRLCFEAIVATLPLAIAVIPWGILTGALGLEIGLSAWQAQAMSLFVFAGAAQISALSLMAGGASLQSLFGSTFVISSRHLLYSIVFRQRVIELPIAWRAAIGFVLTDEMFAVSEAKTRQTGHFSALYALCSGWTFYVIWNLATWAGIVIGDSIQDLESLGLDFAIAATFIAMTFNELRRFPVAATIVASGLVAVLIKPLFPDGYIIIAAVIGMCVGFFLSDDDDKSFNASVGTK